MNRRGEFGIRIHGPRGTRSDLTVGIGPGGSNEVLGLTETLRERLRQDIILGILPPATKLKLEALSRRYEVSVSTLRETLSRLSAEGLVVAEEQKGFAVPPVSTEDLREITEMRQLLECQALRLSIEAADIEWEARLIATYHKLSRSVILVDTNPERHGGGWERYNREFHDALISNCRSRWLMHYRRSMYDHSLRYRMLSLKTKPFPRSQSAAVHRNILDAALSRDAERCVQLLRAHILKSAQGAGLTHPSA